MDKGLWIINEVIGDDIRRGKKAKIRGIKPSTHSTKFRAVFAEDEGRDWRLTDG